MDRLLEGVHTIALKGESMRRAKARALRHERRAQDAAHRTDLG
jgi:hypothetical protein